jgi:hypothetical protein
MAEQKVIFRLDHKTTREEEAEIASRLAEKGYIEEHIRDEIVKYGISNLRRKEVLCQERE